MAVAKTARQRGPDNRDCPKPAPPRSTESRTPTAHSWHASRGDAEATARNPRQRGVVWNRNQGSSEWDLRRTHAD
eukprot:10218582-Lingulodinium_polyedra.AAC.1